MRSPVILFLLLIVSQKVQSIAQQAALSSSSTNTIQPKGIPSNAILNKPQPPGVDLTTCGGLWEKYGFVCDKQKIVDFEAKKVKEIERSLTNTITLLDSLNSSQKLLRNSSILGKELKEKFTSFFEGTSIDKIKANLQKCWKFTKQARSTSYCSRCAGDFDKYWLQTSNQTFFLASHSFCVRAIDSCKDHIEEFSILAYQAQAGILQQALEILADRLQMALSVSKRASIDLLDMISRFSTFTKTADSSSDTNKEDAFCSISLKFDSFPLFVKILPLLEGPIEQLKILLNQIGAQARQLLRRKPLLNSNWRLLSNSEPSSDSPFAGEVAILNPTDNMFTAFDGAQGTTLHNNDQSRKPMNMSLIFP